MILSPILLMSGGVMQAIQLLAALSFLIALHEFGHFFFARLFKTRVEKFYLFFDFLFPFSGLLNFSLFKKKVGDTEYGIGWFPLGGYVKISGMIDESMDKEALSKPPEPWEYRSKKAYQRLFIMLGGIIMNVLIAIALYIAVFGIWGEEFIPMNRIKYGVAVDSIGRSIGLRNGDHIKAIDGKPLERFNEIPLAIIFHKEHGTITVGRDGKDTSIAIPFGSIGKLIKADRNNIISPRMPSIVDSVAPNTIAAQVHMQKGDSIVSVNGTPTLYYNDFNEYKASHFGQDLAIAFYRNQTLDTIHANIPKDSSFGITWHIDESYVEKVTYPPLQAVSRGTAYAWSRLKLYVEQFKLFGSKEVKAHESMGGFYSMGKMFAPEFHWRDFLMLTAFISVALAFMNLLPIPGLDGGYVVFLLFEILTGKQVSEKVMERATTVGLVILLALMVYVNGLDVLRIFGLK